MQYKIDYMKSLELKSTLALTKEVFDECNKDLFEEEGLENFYNIFEEEKVKSQIENGELIILVARTTYNEIIGTAFVSAEKHINLIVVASKYQRKEIGTNLLKFAINICKYNEKELEKVTVNSFSNSIEFFRKYGFEELDSIQTEDGIDFIPMVYYLDKSPETENDNIENIDEYKEEKDNNKIKKYLEEYYTENDEDNRLKISKKGNIEFITTTTYIEKYLCRGDKVLEIGAGTGVYSNYYAMQGYKVTSVEPLDVNLEKLNELKSKNLKVIKGNGTDLSKFADNSFDITLCLGPMYHLFSEEEQNKAISEAIRVTKPCGKIFFSYVTNDSVIINHFLRDRHLVDQKHLHDEEFNLKNSPEQVFFVCTVKEFKNKIQKFNVKLLNNVATDGIASIVNEDLEYLDEDEFEEWVKYHLATCERKDLIGYSSHVLLICEKE